MYKFENPINNPARRKTAAIAAMTAAAFMAMAVDPARAGERFDAECATALPGTYPEATIITGFKTGSSGVPEEQEQEIADAAQHLKYEGKVCVIGQADKRGDYAGNDKLAMKRARAVAARLIAAGLDPRNLALSSRAEAYGDGFPDWFWFSGNRRVEIVPVQ